MSEVEPEHKILTNFAILLFGFTKFVLGQKWWLEFPVDLTLQTYSKID